MTARRFFIQDASFVIGGEVALPAEEVKHLFKVLRAVDGDELVLLDGKGTVACAVIAPGRRIVVRSVESVPPPRVRVHVFPAAPRRQKMDQMLKQCAEVGAWSITPISAARSVALPSGDSVLDRWRVELAEACKQSGNPYLPDVSEMERLASAVSRVTSSGFAAFYGDADGAPPRVAVERAGGRADLAWFVGPEGGFTPEEKAMMDAAGFAALSVGPWTMRVETAAPVGAALLLMCFPGA